MRGNGLGARFGTPPIAGPAGIQTRGDLLRLQIAGVVHPGQKFEDLGNFEELNELRIRDMAHVWMPPDALPLNKMYSIACPNTATTNTVVGTFKPQPNWWAVFKWIALCQTGANFPEGSGAMTWRVLLSGNPVSDFGNVIIQIGNINGSIVPQEVGPIIVRPNTQVVIQVDNLNINPVDVNVIAVLRGWEWPMRRRI